ncbi:hypothetical protein D3C72_955360 [compost metagenome]
MHGRPVATRQHARATAHRPSLRRKGPAPVAGYPAPPGGQRRAATRGRGEPAALRSGRALRPPGRVRPRRPRQPPGAAGRCCHRQPVAVPALPACAGPVPGCLRPPRFRSRQGAPGVAQAARQARAGNNRAPCQAHHWPPPSQPAASGRRCCLRHAPGWPRAGGSLQPCGLAPAVAAPRPGSCGGGYAAPVHACQRSRPPAAPRPGCPGPAHRGRWTPGTGHGHSG